MTSKTALLLILVCLFVAGFPTGVAAATGGTQATFVRTDTSTQGNWKGVYGLGGYVVPNNTNANQVPAYAAFTPQNQSNWTWTTNGTEVRDLQVSSSPASFRQASCWYTSSNNSYDLDVNITDGNTHQFALYLLDWDQKGRAETIQAVDGATGAVLDTRSASNFTNGIYYIWDVSGHVKFNVTVAGGLNAVVSGAFFDIATAYSAPGIAHFVSTDTSTQGNWHGVYGADGYTVVGDVPSTPSYAALATANDLNWTWAQSTNDQRALQLGSGSGRIAATWYNSSTFSIDVNFTDGNSHPFALYAVDWDNRGRAETIQLVDAQTKAVLDSRSIFNFTNGIYLVWSISGHVTLNITSSGGPNAVVSGVFFGTGGNSPSASGGVAAPAAVALIQPISVSLTPSAIALNQSQTESFTASVGNSANQSVTWSISPNLGTISSAGVYTAPAAITSAQTVTVTATSIATPVGSASATVSLVPSATTSNPGTSNATLPSGLVLHWTFDTANISGTTVTDTSNNGGTGTLYGNPAVVAGEINQALSFNGVNSYVSMSAYADTKTAFNNNITLAAWINTTNAANTGAIISKFTAAGSAAGYIFETNAAGHLVFRVGATDLTAYPGSVVDTAKVNDGQWHHVAVVVTVGQGVQFYVDGKLSSTAAMSLWAGGDGWSNLEVGSCSYTPYAGYFAGDIDDVQIYSRALSASEINTVFSGNAGGQNQLAAAPAFAGAIQSQTVATQGFLSVSPSAFNFGSVTIGSSASQTFAISNSGTATVTLSNVSISGAGLNASGVSTGAVLAPGQSVTLSVTYAPAAAVGLSGGVTFTSNASDSTLLLTLTGTGVQPPVTHSVVLTWGPSASSTVVGYDVYRGTVSGGPYTLLTTSAVTGTSYTDSNGQVGMTDYYVVTSVDSSGVQSGYSNVVSATIP